MNERSLSLLIRFGKAIGFAAMLYCVSIAGIWLLEPSILDMEMAKKLAAALSAPVILFLLVVSREKGKKL